MWSRIKLLRSSSRTRSLIRRVTCQPPWARIRPRCAVLKTLSSPVLRCLLKPAPRNLQKKLLRDHQRARLKELFKNIFNHKVLKFQMFLLKNLKALIQYQRRALPPISHFLLSASSEKVRRQLMRKILSMMSLLNKLRAKLLATRARPQAPRASCQRVHSTLRISNQLRLRTLQFKRSTPLLN